MQTTTGVYLASLQPVSSFWCSLVTLLRLLSLKPSSDNDTAQLSTCCHFLLEWSIHEALGWGTQSSVTWLQPCLPLLPFVNFLFLFLKKRNFFILMFNDSYFSYKVAVNTSHLLHSVLKQTSLFQVYRKHWLCCSYWEMVQRQAFGGVSTLLYSLWLWPYVWPVTLA